MAAFFSARSTSGLSSVGGQNSLRKSAPPGCTSRPDGLGAGTPWGTRYRSRQDDDEACPPDTCAFGESQKPLRQVHKVRTDRAGLAAGKIRLHPSMQAD